MELGDVWASLVHGEVFSRGKGEEIHHALSRFKGRIDHLITVYGVTTVRVELVSVSMNLNTVRRIAYFEAMPLLSAAQHGVPVEQLRTTTACKRAMGKGNAKKHERQAWVTRVLGSAPSEDEADAAVFAMAREQGVVGSLEEVNE